MRTSITAFFVTVSLIAAAQFRSKEDCQAYAESENVYYDVDLGALKEDRLSVKIEVPPHKERTMIFCMPKIVPGIYGAMDFGQLVENIHAVDVNNNPLEVERLDVNRWKIRNARLLRHLFYDVNDGWEEFGNNHEKGFLSASSTFRENTAFVINHNALFGYLDGYEHNGIVLSIKKPEGLTGYTGLERYSGTETVDNYIVNNYRALVDQPILYCKAEAATFALGGVNVQVAMHSSTGKSLAPQIATFIQPLMQHQQQYLGGELPVSTYTFLLYHNENPETGSARGDGLEHANSTLILLYTAFDPEMIQWNVYGIASHEFFHTIVPLGLHSEEIANYDFNDSKLSRHLWLYEGLTEYFTIHMPVKERLITIEEFLSTVQQKLKTTQQFAHERSLTFLSEHAMNYQDQYMDFYSKGTLANLCLDIRLRELSNGAYGVQQMTADLMKEYGPYKAFKDKKLFDEIARVSGQPEIRKFFKAYVEGTEPLPLKETFAKVGITYDETSQQLSLVAEPTESQLALRKAWIGSTD